MYPWGLSWSPSIAVRRLILTVVGALPRQERRALAV